MTAPTSSDIPLIGHLTAGSVRSEMGRKGEQRLTNLVAKIVNAAAANSFGRSVFENVYLAASLTARL